MDTRLKRELTLTGSLLAALACYALVILLAGKVSPLDYLAFLLGYIRTAIGLWLFAGCIAIGWSLWREKRLHGAARQSLQALVAEAVRRRWISDRCISFLSPPLLFAVLMASFNTFKQRVLPQAGFGFDAAFAQLDRILFLGNDPWRVTHELFASPFATWAIDLTYHVWFAPMTLGVMACAFLPMSADRLRYRYLISYGLLWIVGGSLLAFAVPAAGPCFQPTSLGSVAGFEPLVVRLAEQRDWLAAAAVPGGLTALHYQTALLDLFGQGELTMGAGISAMPSMHNGLATLFAIGAFQFSRSAGWAMTAYAALIWLGSIHLGWHYAVDGPVGALVAIAVWRASGRFADHLLSMPRRLEPAPAGAASFKAN